MERTIRVKGTGKAEAKADLVRLTFDLSTIDLEYEKAFSLMEKSQTAFKATMKKLGFEKDSVKSTQFSVREQYDYVKNKHVFRGFQVSHSMQVCFDFSSERLSQVLYQVKSCKSSPSIGISFMTKDQEALKKRVLENAVTNARERAEVIAKAAGCRLGEILSIDHSWQDVRFESRFEMNDMAKCCCESINPIEIEPEDVELEDTVSIIWQIE